MSFGRNRESRSREAAGRGNRPEAVPGKWATENEYVRDSVKSAEGQEHIAERTRRTAECWGQLLVALSETRYDLLRHTPR